MAKARKKYRPAKRPHKTKVGSGPATRESVLEGRRIAELRKAAMEQAEKAAEWIRKVAPPLPSKVELAERAAKHAEASKEMRRYIAIRDGQIPPPWVVKKSETPNSRAGTQSAVQNTVGETKTATKTCITDEARRMKAADEIPTGIKITHFAQKLAKRMAEAACVVPSIRPVTWQYIKNELPGWGLWPISKI